jgi:hypothetical protein
MGAAFEIVTIPVGVYDHHPSFDNMDAEIARIVDLLSGLGGVTDAYQGAKQPLDERAVRERLRAWVDRAAPSGALVWLGHGVSDGDDAWLASSETPDPIHGNGIVPKTVADQIDADWRRRADDDTAWAMVVIEACGAGTFVSEVFSLLRKGRPLRLALVGVGGDGAAYLGRFSDALSRVIGSYTVNDESIRLRDFMNQLQDRLLDDDVVHLARVDNQVALPRQRLVETPLSGPIDIYTALVGFLAKLPPDERSHFIPKAQGAERGELAWYFAGRVDERRRLSGWLRENMNGMLIVTGRAGVGKSALLGNLLTYAYPGLRELRCRGAPYGGYDQGVGSQARRRGRRGHAAQRGQRSRSGHGNPTG